MSVSGFPECVFDLVKPFLVDCLGNVFCVDDRVSALRDSMDALNATGDDVRRSIGIGERKMQAPAAAAETWLQQVAAIGGEVESIKKKHGGRLQCLGGCYLNCWSSIRIGSIAADKLHRIEELQNRASTFPAVAGDVISPPVQELPMASIVQGDSVQIVLDMVFEYLGDNSTSGEIAGIWGTGGIGKTTILKKINNSLKGDSRFHHVLFVVASKECTTQKIQHSIVQKLKLRKEDDVEEQARTIHHFLCNKKFVLLLDDVWEFVDLEEVGLPASRKVVLTTRSEAVCGDMQAHRRIKVGFLNLEDARSLFLNNVGEAILNRDPSIRDRQADDVIAECGGLPLALVTIGKVMSSKRASEEWQHVIKLLRNNQFPPGTDQNLFSKLKLSFDFLKEDGHRERECFLCCALWPEDYDIKKEDLINCWMGHGLLDDTSDIYLEGYTIIGNLLASCLLEPGNGDGTVKMHDVVRDMALWIVSQRGDTWIVRAGLGLTGEAPSLGSHDWNRAQRISLAYNKMESLPSWIGRDSEKLNTLILRDNKLLSSSTNLLSWPCYSELKYLDLSDNEYINSSGSVFSLDVFECMKNLEYLNLSDLYSTIHLDELPPFPNLKYLLLRNNKVIAQKQPSIPPKLLVLDVLNEHKRVEHGMIIDGLCHHNQGSHNKWLSLHGVNVQSVQELRRASSLNIRSLVIYGMEGHSSLNLADPDVLGNDYFKYKLRDLWITWYYHELVEVLVSGSPPTTLTSLCSLRLLCLGSLKKMIFKGLTPADFFPRLRHITIICCNVLSHASWVLHLPCLEELTLCGCYKMKYVIIGSQVKMELDREKRNIAFPRLKGLYLWNMPALVGVCDYTLMSVPPLLEWFTLAECMKLRRFPFMRVATAGSTMDGESSSSSKESSRQAATTRSKLLIVGHQEWWNRLIWDVHDEDSRAYFQQFFQPLG